MDDYYDQIKEDVAIREELDDSKMDLVNDEAYQKLRPFSPYKFRELISKEKFNPKKFIEQQRVKDRISGGFGNSLVFKNKN